MNSPIPVLLLRSTLTLVAIWFIWGETGPITAIAIGLLAASNEIVAIWMRTMRARIRDLEARQTSDHGKITGMHVHLG